MRPHTIVYVHCSRTWCTARLPVYLVASYFSHIVVCALLISACFPTSQAFHSTPGALINMDFKLLLALVLLICLAKGQTAYDDFDDEIDVNNATASTTTETDGEINVHIINVESDAFYPNSINANPDDRVTFVFHSGNHSVIQSLYGWPCIPQAAIVGQKGFHSGTGSRKCVCDVANSTDRLLPYY